ncbi:hypothetical protein JCM5353_000990 [Sporobolomyces roseus]
MFYYLCRIINVTASLLYPTYASYKALKGSTNTSAFTTNDDTDAKRASVSVSELERWSMYWSIMAVVWAFQDWIEWSVSWFPFYYEFKTLVILWLVLPQIQGSTYLYQFHLSPFLSSHENDIDHFLSSSRSRLRSLGASYVNRLIHSIRDAVLGTQSQSPAQTQGTVQDGGLTQWFNQTNALNVLATGYATLRPLAHAPPKESEGEKRSERLRRKETLRKELEELDSSNSNSNSSVEEEEDEEDPSSPAGYSSSSSSSNLTHAKLRRGGGGTSSSRSSGPGKRYEESQLGGESVFEELGGEDELRGYRKGKGGLTGEGSKEGVNKVGGGGGGGGWFGWGSGGGGGGEKGKAKGKQE